MKKSKSIKKGNLDTLQKKLDASNNEFDKSMRDIAPFIKKSNTYSASTAGKWRDATYISDVFISRQN